MSRIADTERGARIAFRHANEVLASPDGSDLFPQRLTAKQRQLWLGIKRVSQEHLDECAALRSALAGQGDGP